MCDFVEALRAQLAVHPRGARAEWEARPAAVLVPLYHAAGEWQVLLTERAHTVAEHQGQVAFPGGRADPEDADRVATALREAEEEVGLRRQHVTVLGELDELFTVSQYRITPVVGVFPWPYSFELSYQELSEVFGVPLRWLANPTHRETRYRHPLVADRPVPVYYFHYEAHTIWGITARIILNLLEVSQALLPEK